MHFLLLHLLCVPSLIAPFQTSPYPHYSSLIPLASQVYLSCGPFLSGHLASRLKPCRRQPQRRSPCEVTLLGMRQEQVTHIKTSPSRSLPCQQGFRVCAFKDLQPRQHGVGVASCAHKVGFLGHPLLSPGLCPCLPAASAMGRAPYPCASRDHAHPKPLPQCRSKAGAIRPAMGLSWVVISALAAPLSSSDGWGIWGACVLLQGSTSGDLCPPSSAALHGVTR